MRPDWDHYFLNIARAVSLRSMDSQTQHGAVVVNEDNHIIGTGYNSFPKGMLDHTLPNTRPDKYPWMIHAEANACSNCVIRPKNCKIYVTGESCFECLKTIWAHGIIEVIQANVHGSYLIDDKQKTLINTFVEQTKIKIKVISLMRELNEIESLDRDQAKTCLHVWDHRNRCCSNCGLLMKEFIIG